jgi:hypothetical protein
LPIGCLTAVSAKDRPARKDEIEALKHRVAELLVECKANPAWAS